MLNWLTGKRNRKELPEYSALRAIPTRGVPPDLAAAEGSESFATSRENLERELRKLPRLALDRCPRCPVFTTVGTPKTSDDLIGLWSIFKATQLTRGNLYFSYALESARAGRIEIALDVALETVGHVNLEDPRPHLLLGQVAVKLRDRELLREAKSFLQFFKLERWERKLDQVVQSGSPDFEDPAWTASSSYP